MKKLFPILLVFIIATLFFKCIKIVPQPLCCVYPIGRLDLNFKAFYADKPLVMNQLNDYNGKKIRFTKLQFFLTTDINYFDDIATTAQLDSVPIVSFINLTPLTDATTADAGVTISLNAGMGDKTAMKFDIGVSKSLNAKLPKNFTPSEILFDTTNYRNDWKSYVFMKFEGELDKDSDGIFETIIKLHTGGDALLKTLKFNKNYKIDALKTTKVNLELNINELLKGVDLAAINQAQQMGISPTTKQIMDNFITALILK
jgi:hypothetical protein